MEVSQYISLTKSLQLKTDEFKTIQSLFEKINADNSNKLQYDYKIDDRKNCKITPKIIWGGFQDLHLDVQIEQNELIVNSRIEPLIKMVILISAIMLLAFMYQLSKEEIPLWIFPLLVFLPFYFQFVVYWQQNKLFEKLKKDLTKSDLIRTEMNEYT